jgi:hypothetical protein
MREINYGKFLKRFLLFAVLLVVHYVFMFLPVLELFILYLIMFKPKWFEDF